MQTFITLLPTILLVGAGVVAFVLREAIKQYVSNAVAHGFRVELVKLRNELDAERDALNSLTRAVLDGLSGRQSAMDRRRLEAAGSLWACVMDAAPLKMLATYLVSINYEAALASVRNNAAGRQAFAALVPQGAKEASDALSKAGKERPFLSESVWAIFSVLAALLSFANLRFHLLTTAVALPQPSDERLKQLLIEILPARREDIERRGALGAGFEMLSEIESMLLLEIRRFIEGQEQDESQLQRAAGLIRTAEQIRAESAKAETTSSLPSIR